MNDADGHMPLPTFKRGTDELKAFWLVRGWITNAVDARGAAGGRRSPQESATGLLKRKAYELVLHYISLGDVRTFERAVRAEGRQLPAKPIGDNPFHFGLLALFPDTQDFSRQDRHLFGVQMLYACRHNVPPQLLVGFIYQCGSQAEIRRKADRHTIEPGFEAEYQDDIWEGARRPPQSAPTP